MEGCLPYPPAILKIEKKQIRYKNADRRIKSQQLYQILSGIVKMPEMLIKGVYLESSIWDTIEEESKKIERSRNWMISKILKDWIENNKTKDKKARAKTG